jgi:hypothetical protein
MYVYAARIIWSGQGMYAIMIESSTYVGMITVRRARQPEKAPRDMVTREVGRDRKVRASLPSRESYKRRKRRRRRRRRRSPLPGLLQIYYNLTHT